ncbi:MAG TPA: acyl-CoA desaturase [Candidatus Polarisedimenticolaceae bacterium]|nr:acyl-CoA desaturase [Candidatus Polarisedimenticolaceae bacterium]
MGERSLPQTGFLRGVTSWFDTSVGQAADVEERMDWARVAPFVFLHVGCLFVLWVGWSPIAVALAISLWLLRAFFVTAFYHRYFSHRTYKTSRVGQFLFAFLGNTAAQRGPLWWSAHHRQHHATSDREGDPHSPIERGFWWSHVGWLTSNKNFPTNMALVPDLACYPELRLLDRLDTVAPMLMIGGLYGLGEALEAWAPGLGTNGWQLVVWGFFVSTVILFHGTCLVNSAAHKIGSRRFETRDESRNSLLITLLTMGEGWHNNHHYYPAAARQGFYPSEIDPTFYLLKLMQWCGLIWDLQAVPPHVLAAGRKA